MRHKLENKINDLVTNLLNDYNQERTIDKINTFDHPDKEAIIGNRQPDQRAKK